jgi:Clp amino terminal domain, pathogenicity island component
MGLGLWATRIVKQDSSPDVTFYPDAIPTDRTLVLAAEWDARRTGRPPLLVMRVMMVRGPAPACVGEIFKRVKPFERFTAGARRVVDQAREEARELGHRNIGPVHILLALIDESDGAPARVLRELGADLERIRYEVIRLSD